MTYTTTKITFEMHSDFPAGPLSKTLRWLAWLIGIALFLLVSSIASLNYMEREADASRVEKFKRIENDTLPVEVSKRAITVASLIATPEKYHNQYVCVKGYLNLEFEGDAIYWRQRDYRANQYKNSLYVQFADSLYQTKPVAAYSQHYVIIKGVFDAAPGGHGGLTSGAITKISSLNAIQSSVR